MRDLVGYGAHRPDPQWPGGARLAVNFTVNYEEGAEESTPDGFDHSEAPLTDGVPAGSDVIGRDLAAESLMAYGARVGVWRILRMFEERAMAGTLSACAVALERNPLVAPLFREAGFDLLGHGWRFTRHYLLDEATEREHMERALESFEQTWGARPSGWYCRYGPSVNTRALVSAHGISYDSDAYDDELPYWTQVDGQPHLVVPHTFSNNDNKYTKGWWATSDDAYAYLKDAFDVMYAEGAYSPGMMMVSIHPRVSGHPARAAGLGRFLDYVASHEDVWVARREDIATHWRAIHPSAQGGAR
ncbi:allantoinase [Microbacterium sp. NPDC076911]|uniref:allantoinase n=1 Tax=Microbacterium sp. NPDC076911 TaxID=3154958 RepID=UPI00341FD75C